MKVICRECRALLKGIDGGDVVGYRYTFEFNPRQGQSAISIDTDSPKSYVIGREYGVMIHVLKPWKKAEAKKK